MTEKIMTENEYRAVANAAAKAGEILGVQPDRIIIRASNRIIRKLQQMTHDMEYLDGGDELDVMVILYAGSSYVKVRIKEKDSNIVLIEKNGDDLINV